jgi:CRP-like cAMP-binding protein
MDILSIKRAAIFSDLSNEEIEQVATFFKQRSYRRNAIIFVEEEAGKYMYLIKEGRIKISKVLPNGKETILAFHQEGDFFGEMSLIDGGTSPATVTAVSATTLWVISAHDFASLLGNCRVANALLKLLCRRCRDAWAQIEVLAFHNAGARVRTALYRLCKTRGVETARGVVIPMKLTHRELADISGIARETASRILGHLQDEDLVHVETRQFIVKNPERLVGDLAV